MDQGNLTVGQSNVDGVVVSSLAMGELARVVFDVVSSLAMGEMARVAFDVVVSSLAMGEMARVAF